METLALAKGRWDLSSASKFLALFVLFVSLVFAGQHIIYPQSVRDNDKLYSGFYMICMLDGPWGVLGNFPRLPHLSKSKSSRKWKFSLLKTLVSLSNSIHLDQ